VVILVVAVAVAALLWTVGPSVTVSFLLRSPIILLRELASLFRPASSSFAVSVLENPPAARIFILGLSQYLQSSGTAAGKKLFEPIATTASETVLNPPSRNLLTPDATLPPDNGITPSVTVPGVTAPGVSTPTVSVPDVTVPSVSTPTVSLPDVTVPSVSTPTVSVPYVTVPSVSTPSESTPSAPTPSAPPPSVPAPSAPAPSAPGTTPGGGGVTPGGGGGVTIGPVKLP
jgi:hypothetical protein